jgi:hypothetical protein
VQPIRWFAQQAHASLALPLETKNESKQRRLPSSVWACDSHELVLADGEIDVLEYLRPMGIGERDI